MTKRIEDLLSDDEIVQDKLYPADILITKTIKPARPTPEVNKTNSSIKIRGIAKRDKNNSLGLRKDIQKKISKLCQDLVTTIKHLQNRRKRYLEEILPYIKGKLFDIYRLDNEELTYNQSKNEYLKDLFPDDATAIAFKKKYLKH